VTDLVLTIGDKNLSSWSLRPWLLLTQAGIPFTEQNIKLDQPETRKILSEKSPSGLVPFLTHGDVSIWDSLAISEYVAEQFPKKQLWPAEAQTRAVARSVACEMHSGFATLRTLWPMHFLREGMQHLTTGGVQRDIDRINQIWTDCRTRFGEAAGGDEGFLFGAFSIADAMFAPVVSRFVTYGPVSLSPKASAYRDFIWSLPAMTLWADGARAELAG